MRKVTILLAFLFFVGANLANAQTRTVSGKVTSSEDGAGIPGVTVQVKGTTVGTVTDIDGNYSLEVKPDFRVLIFQYVGMSTQEITIADQTTINVTMSPDVLLMEEVVVTAIGIPKEQKAIGYTVQDVSAEQIANSGNTDMISALQGRIAGVQVTSSSGAAGGANYITIRGATSLTGNNQPLFVVDGVPIDNSTSFDTEGFQGGDVAGVARGNRALDINPDDIENISVLKGGAATALYGIRGANGVIVVTTKKGKATADGKKVNVNFSSSVMISQISQVPELNTKYAQGWGGDWSSGFFAAWGPEISQTGYSKDAAWANGGWADFDVDGDIVMKTDPRYDASLGATKVFDQFDFFQTGMTFNNSISLTGGNDKSNFYISASDMSDKGVIPNNEVKRNTFKISGSSALSDKFKISGNANYLVTNGDRIQQGSNTSGVMLGLLRTPPSFDNAAGYKLPDGRQRNYRHGGGYDNPYWTANENLWKDETNRLIGNIQLDWFATEWLRFTLRPGIDVYSEHVKNYVAVGSRTSPGGTVYARDMTHKDFNNDFIAYLTHDFSDKISTYATFGWNMQSRYYSYVFGQANGLSIPDYYNLNNTSNISSGENTWEKRLMGIFFDVGVNYNSMLYVNVTGRNDWSTTLPEDHNSFFYPSVNASFIVSELPFLKDNDILPFWKIFGSYAITANDADPYRTLTYWFQGAITDGWVSPSGVNFPITTGGKSYNGFTYGNTMGSNDLKPERTKSMEVGTSMKFLNNRVGIDFAYFDNLSEDLLLPIDIDPSTGFTSMYKNAASMSSKGIELAVYATPYESKNFDWNILVNFSKFKNVVESLAEGVDALFLGGFTDPQIRAVAGEEYRTIYGYDWQRNDAGEMLIGDDGYPMGEYTMKALGTVNPTWTMGVGNTFQIFDFSIYALVDFRQGGTMWNGTRGALDYFGASAGTENRDDDYVFEGVNVNTGQPNTVAVKLDQTWRTSGEGSGFTGPTSPYLEETSWIRLRDISVSYTLNNLLKNTFVDNLEIYFTGKNLWLSTPNYTGIDPETSLLGSSNALGMDYFNMPGTKTYLFGLRASF